MGIWETQRFTRNCPRDRGRLSVLQHGYVTDYLHRDRNADTPGYYIHSCQKMRYKGAYKPQYILGKSSSKPIQTQPTTDTHRPRKPHLGPPRRRTVPETRRASLRLPLARPTSHAEPRARPGPGRERGRAIPLRHPHAGRVNCRGSRGAGSGPLAFVGAWVVCADGCELPPSPATGRVDCADE